MIMRTTMFDQEIERKIKMLGPSSFATQVVRMKIDTFIRTYKKRSIAKKRYINVRSLTNILREVKRKQFNINRKKDNE